MTLVWALPASLAATRGISKLISFPLPTKMFQFGRCRFPILWIQIGMMENYFHRVAPFGYLRVYAFFQLTGAFRRYTRPSSPVDA